MDNGFYEKQQVLDQLTNPNGLRVFANKPDAMDQYCELMSNAVAHRRRAPER